MKKVILSLIIFSFLFAAISFAQEIELPAVSGVELPSSGITPDSNFYFLKSWKESIQTFFTFGAENKAKQFLHLAEVRLAEYQKMIEKGKTEIAQKTLDKYEKQLNHALAKAEEAKEKGKDVEKLKEAISEKIIKHQEVLIEVLNKVPEEAKKGIENAIEMSQKEFENAIQAVTGEKKEELQRKAEEVKSRIKEKIGKEIIESKPVEPGVCIQVITPAISPENVCKEFPTPCDVPEGWKKVDKCPSASVPSTPSTPPKPFTSSESTPTEIRYYTCPDGTKVESGKCYGTGEKLACSIVSSPELKCSAQTPPVTKGGECQTAGEIKYYQCPSSSQVSQTPWCVCGPESGLAGAKNAWRCQHLPELSCPKPTPTASSDYISCTKGGMKDHACSDGTIVRWQCKCLNIIPQATAYWVWNCVLNPTKFCSASDVSTQPAISEIEIRHYGSSIQIFWQTNIPTISYMEYGPTTSYGSRSGGSTNGSLNTPGTQFVVEEQHLSIGTADNSKLRPDTTYHFRIVAKDTQGNTFVSQDYTFATVPECVAVGTKEVKKYYTCSDGTRVDWCNCTSGGKWDCVSSPENTCPVPPAVVPPTTTEKILKLISPNGGEKWLIGKAYNIIWNSQNVEKVNLGLAAFQDTVHYGSLGIDLNVPASFGKYS